MFDLDDAVLAWRRDLVREHAFTRHDLDELEDHLRAAYEVERHLDPALPPSRAFACACESMGSVRALSREFRKVGGGWWRRLLRAGTAMFGLSFFLPVMHGGITLGHAGIDDGLLPGVQAMLLAFRGDTLEVASALTNVVMLACLWRIGDADRRRVTLTAVAFAACVALDLPWLLYTRPLSDLLAGYYLWLGSFTTTAAALVLRARALPASGDDAPLVA